MRARRLLLALLLAGCGMTAGSDAGSGSPDGPGGVTATFSSLYGDYFGNCAYCHSPNGPGRSSDIEKTLDFSTKSTAYSTIKTGMASGLTGNFMDCNSVPFVGATPAGSLILAVVDPPTRQAFDLPAHAGCDMDTISDETAKVGSQPSAAFITALKGWLTAGAPNN